MVVHTISVVPQSTTTSPSRSAPATSCSQSASTEPAASTAAESRNRPVAAPLRSPLGRRSVVTPQSPHRSSLQPVPSNNGYVVLALAVSTTAPPPAHYCAHAARGPHTL